ncbi:hypothetical protein V5799_017856, partial [Amblyomma americanum]
RDSQKKTWQPAVNLTNGSRHSNKTLVCRSPLDWLSVNLYGKAKIRGYRDLVPKRAPVQEPRKPCSRCVDRRSAGR